MDAFADQLPANMSPDLIATFLTALLDRDLDGDGDIDAATCGRLTDGLVAAALHLAQTHLTPPGSRPGDFALCAVGGYGRGEMAPQSDVDLLFLAPRRITADLETLIETVLYVLWDLRLKVGHSSRTIKQCLKLGSEDYTIRTALLEMRYLTGNRPLAKELENRLWAELFHGTERDFVEAKLAERDHVAQVVRLPKLEHGLAGTRKIVARILRIFGQE